MTQTATKKSKFSPEMARVLKRIDDNTRYIAKIVSSFEYAEDLDGADFARDREDLKLLAIHELIKRRRALKVEFEDEWKRLNA
jgi:hypothetical protein